MLFHFLLQGRLAEGAGRNFYCHYSTIRPPSPAEIFFCNEVIAL